MKVRLGFVTNSSSSSYVCQICGEEETAYDIPDWITYCDNDHYFCREHLSELGIEESRDIPPDACPICTFKTYAHNEMASYLVLSRGIPRAEAFAEIKKVNKRRRVLRDEEYIQYVCVKLGLTEEQLLTELRTLFANWDELCKFIREGRRTCNEA